MCTLHYHQQWTRVPVASRSCKHLVVLVPAVWHSDRCKDTSLSSCVILSGHITWASLDVLLSVDLLWWGISSDLLFLGFTNLSWILAIRRFCPTLCRAFSSLCVHMYVVYVYMWRWEVTSGIIPQVPSMLLCDLQNYFIILCGLVCRLHLCAWCSQRPEEEGIQCSGTGVIDGCELPHGCWESNPGPPLESQYS